MLSEPEFWVAVAFVILMGVFLYVGVPASLPRRLTTVPSGSSRSWTTQSA